MKEGQGYALSWHEWPAGDQLCFTDQLVPITNSPDTLRQYTHRWAHALAYIASTCPALLGDPIGDRFSDIVIDGYIELLRQKKNKDLSIGVVLAHLYTIGTKMAPDTTWDYLRQQRNHYRRIGKRGNPRRDVVLAELVEIGYETMNAVENCPLPSSGSERIKVALEHRDGLLLAFAANFLMRLRNIADRRVEREDVPEAGEAWLFELTGLQTKCGTVALFEASKSLSARLTLHCEVYRPLIPGSAMHDGLWASRKGTPMSRLQIYKRICRLTGAAFKTHHVNLREIRRAGCTAFAGAVPDRAHMTSSLMMHRRLATSERSYNLGGSAAAITAIREFVMASLTVGGAPV